jgi:hypothetical protein
MTASIPDKPSQAEGDIGDDDITREQLEEGEIDRDGEAAEPTTDDPVELDELP